MDDHAGEDAELGPLARLELDAETLGRELVRAYLHQIVVDGFFHADPHPGSVFVTTDKKLALIDLGMVGRLSSRTQDRLLELLLAAAEGRVHEAADVLHHHRPLVAAPAGVDPDPRFFTRRA